MQTEEIWIFIRITASKYLFYGFYGHAKPWRARPYPVSFLFPCLAPTVSFPSRGAGRARGIPGNRAWESRPHREEPDGAEP
jgi:hypothetical protein